MLFVRSTAGNVDARPVTRGDLEWPRPRRYAASLLENHQILILKSILIELGLNEYMIAIWTWQIALFEIQVMKAANLDEVNIARSYLAHDQ